nr:MAG TPA: hypothetical protein [Caudoviricetes sp.]
MERLTDPCWKNLDPWECCGQDKFCNRDCHEAGGCTNGCREAWNRRAADGPAQT